MKELYIPKPTAITEPHIDDAPWIGGGTIRMLHENGSPIRSIQLTDSNAEGLGLVRVKEQEAMMPHLGIDITHFMGHVLRIPDNIEQPDNATREQTRELMVQGMITVYEHARKQKQPIKRALTFGSDGMTGHPQHPIGYEATLLVASEFEEVDEVWVAGMSPDQREDFLNGYDGNYATDVPVVDTSKYKRVEIFRALPHKIAAVEAHKSQMQIDGERFIKRLLNEDSPVEYFNIFTRPELLELAKEL